MKNIWLPAFKHSAVASALTFFGALGAPLVLLGVDAYSWALTAAIITSPLACACLLFLSLCKTKRKHLPSWLPLILGAASSLAYVTWVANGMADS